MKVSLVFFWVSCLLASVKLGHAAHSRRAIVVRTVSENRYDRSITTFDPTGRLLQVEYSMEAAKRGETVAAVLTASGVYVVAVNANGSHTTSRKVHRIDDHLWLVTAGLAGDARFLANNLRSACQDWREFYGEPMTVEQASKHLSSQQHVLTKVGGVRPLGCTAMILGVDPSHKAPGLQSLFRASPGGMLENCIYCCGGKHQERLMAALAERYEHIKSEDQGTIIAGIVGAVREVIDNAEMPMEVWTFQPEEDVRGNVQTKCFMGVCDEDCLRKISEHFGN